MFRAVFAAVRKHLDENGNANVVPRCRHVHSGFRQRMSAAASADTMPHERWEAALIRLLLTVSLCIGGALLRADPAQAQAYPDRPIKVIVPFPAGGPTDGMARIIADRLGTVLGQSIVIENKGGGAGGSIGAKFVAACRSRRLHHPASRLADR